MALIGVPPVSGMGSRVSLVTSDIARFGRAVPVRPLVGEPLIAIPARSGVQILMPGQYQITFNFSFQTTSTTTTIKVRGNIVGSSGPTLPVTYSAPDAGVIVNGSLQVFANVTTGQLLLGADVFALIEAASESGTEDIVWLHSQISCVRIGGAT